MNNLKDPIILDGLKILDKSICLTSKYLAKLSLWIYKGSSLTKQVAEQYKIKTTTTQQWSNRLTEHCISSNKMRDYFSLTKDGVDPAHAFYMVLGEEE